MKKTFTTIAVASIATMLLPVAVFAASENITKTITLVNKSNKTIYPILTVDYKSNHHLVNLPILYHGQTVKYTLPDSTYWQGGRVLLFDSSPYGLPTPYPLNAPAQLVEYTDTADTVDYDISSVDHEYLPVAVQADTHALGYNGINMQVDSFQQNLQSFANANWPYFQQPAANKNSLLPKGKTASHKKIPGGYNFFTIPNLDYHHLQRNMIGPNGITQKWLNARSSRFCDGASDAQFCHAFQKTVRAVWHDFAANAKYNHITFKSQHAKDVAMVQHIIGYVPFSNNQWTGITPERTGKYAKDLEAGVPFVSNPYRYVSKMYPDYQSRYCLNPYVSFIHGKQGLNDDSVYAYSIDDTNGNTLVNGANGFIIVVGGILKGWKPLPPAPVAATRYAINLPSNDTSFLKSRWTSMNVCGHKTLLTNYPKGGVWPIAFDPENGVKTCAITLDGESGNGLVHSVFKINLVPHKLGKPAFNKDCTGATEGTCANSTISYDPKSGLSNLDLPSPGTAIPPVKSKYHLQIASGWTGAVVCGKKQTLTAHSGTDAALLFAPPKKDCAVTLTSSLENASFNISDLGKTIQPVCGNDAVCNQSNLTPDKVTLITPVPSKPSPTPPAPPVTSKYRFAFNPSTWKSATVCGVTESLTGGQAAINFNGNTSCDVSVVGSNGTLNFNLTHDPLACSGTCATGVNVNGDFAYLPG